MENTAKFEKLAQLMELDKSITYDEAYTRVKNAFDAIYVRGGSVEIHEVLEEANEQYKQKKGNKNMENKELTIAELLESASPEMLEIIKKRAMTHDGKKAKQKLQQIRRKFEFELELAISSNGGIEQITPDGDVLTDILLAKPKGLYAVDDYELLKIDTILQSIENGSVMAYIKDNGLMRFEFDYIGSKEACYKFLLDEKKRNAEDVARLHVTINGSN